MKVKIYGAGSIGNHLAHASRSLAWSVDVVDTDPAALERMRDQVYPMRYGNWDSQIGLHVFGEEPRGGYDYIMIGTPPEHHVPLALAAMEEGVSAIQIEKPLCTPDLAQTNALYETSKQKGIPVFVGYDHAISAVMAEVLRLRSRLGAVQTVDVEFREHWGGIFAAHPWLAGPEDTYLGYWNRGGGALGEHSHALHLWCILVKAVGHGRIKRVSAVMDYVKTDKGEYDQLAALNLVTESGLVGRVVQDVVTRPAKKWGRVQGEKAAITWEFNQPAGSDSYSLYEYEERRKHGGQLGKTRPEEFIRELQHIEQAANDPGIESPLALEHGLEVMLAIAAAHRSFQTGVPVEIDYGKGWEFEALVPAREEIQ